MSEIEDFERRLSTINFSGDFESFVRSLSQSGLIDTTNDEGLNSFFRARKKLEADINGYRGRLFAQYEALDDYYRSFHDKEYLQYLLVLRYHWEHQNSEDPESLISSLPEARIILLNSFLSAQQISQQRDTFSEINKSIFGRIADNLSIGALLDINTPENLENSETVQYQNENLLKILGIAKSLALSQGIEKSELSLLFSKVWETIQNSIYATASLLKVAADFPVFSNFFDELEEEKKKQLIYQLYKSVRGLLSNQRSVFEGTSLEWVFTGAVDYSQQVEKQRESDKRHIYQTIGRPFNCDEDTCYNFFATSPGTELRIYYFAEELTDHPVEYYSFRFDEEDGVYIANRTFNGVTGSSFKTSVTFNSDFVVFLDENGEYKRVINDNYSCSIHIITPPEEYTEICDTRPEQNNNSSEQDAIDEEESDRILSRVTLIESEVDEKRFSLDQIKAAGLGPKYRYSLGDTTIYLSQTFFEEGKEERPGKIMYVAMPDGHVSCRNIYKSRSHLIWRVIPYYNNERLGKGNNEHNINLPFGLQKLLWRQEGDISNNKKFSTGESSLYFLGASEFFADAHKKDSAGVTKFSRSVRQQPRLFYRDRKIDFGALDPRREGRDFNYSDFFEENDLPDYSQIGETIEVQAPLYNGTVTVEFLPSKNKRLLYAFFRDKYNRVWTIDPEIVGSPVNSFGVRDEHVDFGHLNTGAFEYIETTPSERLNTGLVTADRKYGDVFFYFLQDAKIIQEYCDFRGFNIELK